MANLFSYLFPNLILLCGMGAICASVEMLIFILAMGGLLVMGFVGAVVFAFVRYFRSKNSEPLSILGDAH